MVNIHSSAREARPPWRAPLHFAVTVLFAIAFAATTAAHADVIHVPDDYPTIQQAIEAAQDGDEVVVAPGTYNEAIDLLGKAITLRSADGPEKTIIDASGLNASVVTINSGEGPGTEIDGFTITGGSTASGFGGGVHVVAEATIRNCIITGNTALSGGGVFAGGGASLIDCTIVENHAVNAGGGIRGGEMTATGCTIAWNTASSGAAASSVGSFGNWTATFNNCVFEANEYTSPWSAAISWASGEVSFNDCAFLDHPGIAVMIEPLKSGTNFTGCLFQDNGSGLLLAHYKSNFLKVYVSDSTFVGHESSAIRTWGRIWLFLDNCTFEGNSAPNGGAIHHGCIDEIGAWCPRTKITGSTFTANAAVENGGAIYTGCENGEYSGECSRTTIFSSTFSDNVAGGFGGVLHNTCTFFSNPIVGPPEWVCGDVSISNSDLTHNSAVLGGGALANLQESSVTLTGVTLCQNAPEPILGDWIDNGGTVVHASADLNCDGTVGVPDLLILLGAWGECADCTPGECPADLTGDCNVGVADLLILLSNWG